jgi:type IV secretory pathway component VirB8
MIEQEIKSLKSNYDARMEYLKQKEKIRDKEDMLFSIFCSLGVLAVFLVLILASLIELNKI